MKKISKPLPSIIGLFVVIVIFSLFAFLFYLFRDTSMDISLENRFSEIYERDFRVKKDLYALRPVTSKTARLEKPLFDKETLEELEKSFSTDHPNDKFILLKHPTGLGDDIEVKHLKPGTVLTVTKIIKQGIPYGGMAHTIFVQVKGEENPSLTEMNAAFLSTNWAWRNYEGKFEFDPEYLERVD